MHRAILSVQDNVIFVSFSKMRQHLVGSAPTARFESYAEKQERMQKERTKDNKSVLFSYRIYPKKKGTNSASTTPPVTPVS